jgi:thiol-disulfide isomerase/thioredoxin
MNGSHREIDESGGRPMWSGGSNLSEFFRFAVAALLIAGMNVTGAPAHAQGGALQKPKIIGVLFHAEWCQECKEMDLIIEDLADKYDGGPVLGIIFDITNQTTRNHAEMLASALGLEELWSSNAGQLGVLYIIDAETKQVLSRLTTEHDFAQMSAEIDKALK